MIIIDQEVKKLLNKSVIQKCHTVKCEFISSVFTGMKKASCHRTILNLKKLNKLVEYHHFKMESLNQVKNLITEDAWMASVDLKDAFFSIPVHKDCQKYLDLRGENFMNFVACPMDLALSREFS